MPCAASLQCVLRNIERSSPEVKKAGYLLMAVISANIGNPQQLDQQPITFFRQVASLLENPLLLQKEEVLKEHLGYKEDVIARARWLLKEVKNVGAYSQSQGVPGIRESVAKFIESMYGIRCIMRVQN